MKTIYLYSVGEYLEAHGKEAKYLAKILGLCLCKRGQLDVVGFPAEEQMLTAYRFQANKAKTELMLATSGLGNCEYIRQS